MNKSPRAFTFSASYIGNTAPASSQLTRIPNISTESVPIRDTTPTEYLPWLDQVVVTGPRSVTVSLQYYEISASRLVDVVSKAISVDGGFGDVSNLQLYSLFLLAPEDDKDDSWYFPKVKAEFDYNAAFSKDNGIVIPLSFSILVNDLDTIPYYKDTVDNLITVMGSRSPF